MFMITSCAPVLAIVFFFSALLPYSSWPVFFFFMWEWKSCHLNSSVNFSESHTYITFFQARSLFICQKQVFLLYDEKYMYSSLLLNSQCLNYGISYSEGSRKKCMLWRSLSFTCMAVKQITLFNCGMHGSRFHWGVCVWRSMFWLDTPWQWFLFVDFLHIFLQMSENFGLTLCSLRLLFFFCI